MSGRDDRGALDRTQAWLLGAQLYLPDAWLTPEARARAHIPATVRFQEKWRHALTLFRQIRAAGFRITAVLADAEFGDNSTLRAAWHRAGMPYAVGISSTLSAFVGTPRLRRRRPARAARPAPHAPDVAVRRHPALGRTLVAAWPARRGARSRGATRPTPARGPPSLPRNGLRRRMRGAAALAPEVWLLAERDRAATPRTEYYLVHLPATASLRALVRLTHQRWAIEQQYQELKDELGLDHFEGRSLPGWQRHAALTAVAYTFLQVERQRRPSRDLTLPRVRAIIQEVLTAHLFVTRPHYLQRMLKLQQVSLRI